ncbi:MAG: nucleoid-associated protein [Marinifilaceae bacterium]
MINFENCQITNIIIHSVGNKFEGGELRLSHSPFLPTDPDVVNLLKNYFLSSFKNDAFFKFIPQEDLTSNPIWNAATNVFSNTDSFIEESVHIAEQLFESSKNPNIKSGELYVVHFTGINIDEGIVDAIGVFKSETKDTFLKVIINDDNYQLQRESGINIKKLDKACLIYNVYKEEGYKLSILDKTNSKEALYWTNDFLGIEPRLDSYFQTSTYLNLCKDFIKDIYNQENNVTKAEQIDLLNRSINFFKEEELFSEDKFKEEIVKEPDVIAAFEAYKDAYVQEKDVQVDQDFNISNYAIKDGKKYFKHILKLDKNFHVYIHGERKYITRGYDSDVDMNYYKLYFYEEN